MPQLSKLPIDPHIPSILKSLSESQGCVVQASPGSGKTTRLPPALLNSLGSDKKILVLEPRRLAAKTAAQRVAFEMGEEPGGTVGYQFRFENVTSAKTRLLFLTEGMLVRHLLSDRELKNVAAVVLDEFHERHIHTDVSLSYLRNLQKTSRPDLKILVMSATLETESLSRFLGDVPQFNIDAPNFEVDFEYSPFSDKLETAIAQAVNRAIEKPVKDPSGRSDILVFLPGMSEIRRTGDALLSLAARTGSVVIPLHGELSRLEQDRALGPCPERKIILSTNVAETSVTINGVTTVIDSGLVRQASYSWWTGLPQLKTKPISRASAIQRAGRAGRTCPGRCIRLYYKADLDKRPQFDAPEIQRADLSQTYLELKILGASSMKWFEDPPDQATTSAKTLLRRLGALDKNFEITALGRAMGELPLHPRLSRVLLDAGEKNSVYEAATLVSVLSEGTGRTLNLLDDLDTRDPLIIKTRERLARLVSAKKVSKGDVTVSLLAGFPDRVSKLNEAKNQIVLCDGGSAQIHDSKILPAGEFFICADVQESIKGTHKRIEARSLVSIDPSMLLDLENDFLKESNEMLWDDQRKAVFQISRLSYGQLILSETRGVPTDKKAAGELLAKKVIDRLMDFCELEAIESLKARLAFLRGHDKSWPELNISELLSSFCSEVCSEKFSVSELKNSDFHWYILNSLGENLKGKLNRYAPSEVSLALGRKVRVNYPPHQAPWIESRLQDFFGMRAGPSLMDGKVPVAMHLLAPNRRAVQVTTDLMSFWNNVYPKLRVELGRRYPRHKWPENPLV